MSSFVLLLLVCYAAAQSLVEAPLSFSSGTPNSCLRRSVLVYTSESSTYVVTDMGSASFMATPTFCANVSTVYGANHTITTPAATVTVYQQPSSTQQSAASTSATGTVVVADDGFEAGNSSPFSNSSSSLDVSAQVVQAGPLQPYSGDNYLLITFNDTSPTSKRARRQTTATMVYNVTQDFAATAGVSYSLSVYAADAQNGATTADCSLIICGDGDCGPGFPITTTYSQYSYQYNADVSENGAVATFSISCVQSAYVALDNVTVVSNSAGSSSALATTTVTQYVTRTQIVQQSVVSTQISDQVSTQIITSTYTTLISGSRVVLTTTVPTLMWSTATAVIENEHTKIFNFTTAVPTVNWATATSSSDSSSSTSSSSSVDQVVVPTPTASGVPAVALAAPTAIAGDPVNGSPGSYDDVTWPVSLPVNLTLFGQSSSNVLVSSNGVVGLTLLDYEYTNYELPYFSQQSSCSGDEGGYDADGNYVYPCFTDTAALGLWDDLFIYEGTQQGIFYEIDGAAPNRQTTFEFYLSHYADESQYYHFLILFFENRPNVVTFHYLNVSDFGASATVGVESSTAGSLYNQYSFNQAVIYPGLQLTFDTTTGDGTYTVDAGGDSGGVPTTDSYSVAGREKDPIPGSKKRRSKQK
ncbi:hypothetical protein LTR85_000909 [Meristemomyces frigidus]|nr:hypothetical protein LTR85_000909 [Meristemomyces frigidus]